MDDSTTTSSSFTLSGEVALHVPELFSLPASHIRPGGGRYAFPPGPGLLGAEHSTGPWSAGEGDGLITSQSIVQEGGSSLSLVPLQSTTLLCKARKCPQNISQDHFYSFILFFLSAFWRKSATWPEVSQVEQGHDLCRRIVSEGSNHQNRNRNNVPYKLANGLYVPGPWVG